MATPLRQTLFVALGGAMGTLFRHALNMWTFAPAFPVGTVIENVTGALLLGVVTGWLATRKDAPDWLRSGVGVGFCGGYTTMSTFAADTFVVSVYQAPAMAGAYVGVSLVFGLALAWFGIAAGKSMADRHGRST